MTQAQVSSASFIVLTPIVVYMLNHDLIWVLRTSYDYHECARPGTDNRYDRDPILLTGLTGIFYDHEYPLSSFQMYGSLNYRREELVHRFIICTEKVEVVISPYPFQVVITLQCGV